jgi:hypothetical protein
MKPKPNKSVAVPTATRLERAERLADDCLQPTALAPPALDIQLHRLGPLERAAEVLRYHLQRTEYWLCPRGRLRAWLRLNIRLALWLGIPTVLLTPVITLILTTAVSWSARVAELARNLAIIPAWLGTGILGFTGVLFLIRLLVGR